MENNGLKLLKDELLKRQNKNPHYSLRSFAKFLEVAPGALSEILSGKRALSTKMTLKISKKLGLSNMEVKELFVEGNFQKRRELMLESDLFNVISNWYHFALLNLIDTKDFVWSVTWISKRLGISVLQVKESLELLERVELIRKKENIYEVIEHGTIKSPEGIPSEAIKKYHDTILNKAKNSLYEQDIEERDISGISFVLNHRDLENLKEDIARFQDEIIEKYGQGKKEEVYHLEMALFRMSEKE